MKNLLNGFCYLVLLLAIAAVVFFVPAFILKYAPVWLSVVLIIITVSWFFGFVLSIDEKRFK